MKKKLLLAFVIPIIIVLISFLILGIHPFGDKTIVVIDANTQYISFITYLRSIFFNVNDFKYTFSATLGGNLIPLFGYYMMSPFNLVTLLFDSSNMQLALTIIILLKIGLSGLTMEYYLEKKYPNKSTLLFSLCYSLMAYNIVYMYHLMWLDSIILFPLIILGIDYIFKNKTPLLYILSLSLSIIFNYYIGIITCLGSVIYFIYKYIFEYKKINKLRVFINYAISSLLSGLTSMFIIIPTLIGLSSGKATFSLSNLKFGTSISYLKVIAKSFTASLGEGETWHGGPMIACGMIIVILLILYFLNKKISKRDKIINGIFILFLMTTFVLTPLDLIFHGLNTPYCFDYRHAFIFVFFIITIAINSYMNLNVNKKSIMITSLIMLLLSIIIYISRFKFNETTYGLTIVLSLIISIIVLIVLLKNKNSYKILFIITIIDLFINVLAGSLMLIMSDKISVSNYKTHVNKTDNIVEKIKEYDNSFYRMEKTYDRSNKETMLTINDSMIFNYNGISHFASTTRSDVEEFMEHIGFRRLLSRTYYNKEGSTNAVNMLLGIKYIASDSNYKDYKEVINDGSLTVYQNPYYLPITYVIKNEFVNIKEESVFSNIDNIVKSFSGIDEDIYEKADYEYENFIEDDKYIHTYLIEVDNNNELYFYFKPYDDMSTNYLNGQMYINDEYAGTYFSKYNWGITSLGKYNIGDIVELKFVFDKEVELTKENFCYENIDILEKHYNELSKNAVNVDMITSSHLKYGVNLEESSKMIFTIPYDEGWDIKVDGKSVEKKKVLDVLMMIEVNEGIHNVELIYTPSGLKIGIIISLTSLACIIVYLIIERKTNHNYKY